jgi:hypothetical protein
MNEIDHNACINCGEANDGGYETEEVGPFCSECFASLRRFFFAECAEEMREATMQFRKAFGMDEAERP